ncbi:MAG: ADP,ATP carrier protein 1 [Chlamydiae bacterium]|nr:ADP,ATP carrier protein 1 [Chlamydiota bacterium]
MSGYVKKKLISVRNEFATYSGRERSFLFYALLCSFFICCEYSIIRPVSTSLFVQSYGARLFPYAWLAIVPFNFLLVSIYNRLIPKWGSKLLFICLIGIIIGVNTLFAALFKVFPALNFLFFMWKEVYVMLMFQLVWSVIHSNVRIGQAKYLYGMFFGVGGLGSILGSSFPGFFAVSYGSENLIYLTLPVYLSLLFVYWKMSQYCSGDVPNPEREKEGGFLHGLKLIKSSRFLIFALLIVMFMQMTVAIVDFQFNDYLERTYPQMDVRTQYSGRVLGIMHTLTTALQFVGAYALIQWVGFRRSHYVVPGILALSASVVLFFPYFAVITIMFLTTKSLDFSVFGIVKEMLYVPLKPDQKFRAKAIIDVFAYRTSKGLASILIIGVTHYVSSHLLSWATITIGLLWIISVSFGFREYEKLTKPEQENA